MTWFTSETLYSWKWLDTSGAFTWTQSGQVRDRCLEHWSEMIKPQSMLHTEKCHSVNTGSPNTSDMTHFWCCRKFFCNGSITPSEHSTVFPGRAQSFLSDSLKCPDGSAYVWTDRRGKRCRQSCMRVADGRENRTPASSLQHLQTICRLFSHLIN